MIVLVRACQVDNGEFFTIISVQEESGIGTPPYLPSFILHRTRSMMGFLKISFKKPTPDELIINKQPGILTNNVYLT